MSRAGGGGGTGILMPQSDLPQTFWKCQTTSRANLEGYRGARVVLVGGVRCGWAVIDLRTCRQTDRSTSARGGGGAR
jgi:hypothetical protein